MDGAEITLLQSYLQKKFSNTAIIVKPSKAEDSAEVYLKDEFLGVLYKDDEDPKDVSYNFDMAILSYDLKSS